MRFAAWLALIAIAMLFIAPAISKSLMQATACPHGAPTTLTMPHMAHGETQSTPCHEAASPHNMLMPGTAQSPMEEMACGYCQLLVNLPFVALLAAAIVLLLSLATRPERPCDYACPILFRPWSPLLARGPPACCFSL